MNFVYFLLLSAAFVLIQCLIGGTRLVYSFPPYALAGVAAVLSLVSIRRPSAKPSALCLISTLLLAGYVVGRAWYSPNAYLARDDMFMAMGALVVYLLTALYLTESRQRNWIIGVFFAVTIVHIGVGLVQFKTGEGFMLFGFIGAEYGMRASGMYICPNHLAGFLEAMTLLALSLTVWSRCKVPVKLLTGYLVLFCLLGVAITGSRGGYLSLPAGLLVFVALSLWVVRMFNRERFWLMLLGAVTVLVLFLGLSAGLMKHNRAINERLSRIDTASEDVRWYNWLASIDQFKLNPVWGTGAGTHLYYGRLFRYPSLQVDPEHSHNDYLEMLAEYGWVGEGLAVLFLITHLGNGLKTVRHVTLRRLCNAVGSARSDTLALTLGSLGAVAAIMAHSVVDFNLHIPGNALLFAFLFGMLGSPGIERPEKLRITSPETLLRGALALGGIGLLAAIATLYPGERYTNQSRIALGADAFPECIRLAELAIAKDPLNSDIHFYQGEAYRAIAANMPGYALREHYFEQAIAAYRNGLKLFPENENLWIRLGQCLDATFQLDEAEEAYGNAIRNDPNLGILYAYYGAHLRLTGAQEGAKKCEAVARKLGMGRTREIGMGEPPTLANSLLKSDSPPVNSGKTDKKTIEQ